MAEPIMLANKSEREKQDLLDELERTYWRRTGKKVLKDWRLYLLLLPLLLVFFFWRYLPLYELIAAFKNNDSGVKMWARDFVGLEYFHRLMFGTEADMFWQAFRNTFLLSFYGLVFGFPMPIILALFFNEVKNNVLRSSFQILTYLPKFVSTVVVTTMITMLLKEGTSTSEPGIIANALVSIKAISREQAMRGMLNAPQYFRAIFQISGIWETAGYSSIVYFAAIISISPTRYEAAQIDGASKFSQLRYVVLPGMASTIIIMLVLRLGEMLSVGYEKVLLLYNRDVWVTADIVSTYVFRTAGIGGTGSGGVGSNLAMGSAADLIAAVLSMVLVIGANKISKKVSDTSVY